MKRPITTCLVTLGIAIQFGTLASMLIQHELTLRRGTAFRFKTAPVDPFDAFRGRYVSLRFDAFDSITSPSRPECRSGQPVHLLLTTNADGFATITGATNKPPSAPYLTAVFKSSYEEERATGEIRTNYYRANQSSASTAENRFWTENVTRPTGLHTIRIARPPFSRFYLPERLAPQAENAYNRSATSAAAIVRVRRGHAVAEDLLIDGLTLREYLKQHPEPEPNE